MPQNVLGKLVVIFTGAKPRYLFEHKIYVSSHFNFGVSLGKYIVFGDKDFTVSKQDVQHEYGHQLQSEKLGWLYLITVGLVSISRNIYDRLFHKSWTNTKRYYWYYSSYPEREADQLGGVYR